MVTKKYDPKKYEQVTFIKKEVCRVPTVIKFRRKDGSTAVIKTTKIIVVPKKVTFLKKKK